MRSGDEEIFESDDEYGNMPGNKIYPAAKAEEEKFPD